MIRYSIRPDDLTDPAVLALLQLHLDEVRQWSPACKVHAMPAERLRKDDVSFFAAWDGDKLAAVGAIKKIDTLRGELKSMRAAPAYRGKGAGAAILRHLIDKAKRRGYRWLGLETGGTVEFEPAMALYRKHGFADCPPFGDYISDEFSRCMDMSLDDAPAG